MTTLQRSPLAVECTAGNHPRYDRVIQLHRWLRRRGPEGLGTWEILRLGWSNPSMLAKELVAAGVAVSKVSENPPGAAPMSRGARLFLAGDAPANATPVSACSDKHPSKSSAAPSPKASTSTGTGHARAGRPRRHPKPEVHLVSLFDGLLDEAPIEKRAA